VGLGQWIRLSDLVTVTVTDGDPVLTYSIGDGNAAQSSAQFWVAGQYIVQGANFTIDAGTALSDIWVQAGTAAATDVISFRATDKDGTSDVANINLVSRRNTAPSVFNPPVVWYTNTSVAAASVIVVRDADGDVPTIYRFQDSAGGQLFHLQWPGAAFWPDA
jgi:hypothetical protein